MEQNHNSVSAIIHKVDTVQNEEVDENDKAKKDMDEKASTKAIAKAAAWATIRTAAEALGPNTSHKEVCLTALNSANTEEEIQFIARIYNKQDPSICPKKVRPSRVESFLTKDSFHRP